MLSSSRLRARATTVSPVSRDSISSISLAIAELSPQIRATPSLTSRISPISSAWSSSSYRSICRTSAFLISLALSCVPVFAINASLWCSFPSSAKRACAAQPISAFKRLRLSICKRWRNEPSRIRSPTFTITPPMMRGLTR